MAGAAAKDVGFASGKNKNGHFNPYGIRACGPQQQPLRGQKHRSADFFGSPLCGVVMTPHSLPSVPVVEKSRSPAEKIRFKRC